MKRLVWAGALAVVVGLWAGQAAAQQPGMPRLGATPPPGYSPYLNLVRGGNPGAGYYGLVRPQQYFQGAIRTLQAQQQLMVGPGPAAEADGSDLAATGVPAQFMNHNVFFMNMGGAGIMPNRGGAPAIAAGLQPPARPAPRAR